MNHSLSVNEPWLGRSAAKKYESLSSGRGASRPLSFIYFSCIDSPSVNSWQQSRLVRNISGDNQPSVTKPGMNSSHLVLLTNLVATLFMVGLIWMVQIVHYPLFDDVGEQNYLSYQQRHQSNITYIVLPVMLVELVTAVMLLWYPIEGVDKSLVYGGIGLVIVIWLSTAFLQVPCHDKLVKGFDPAAYRWLVDSNWIRTFAWSLRGGLVTWMLVRVLSK